MVKYGTGRLGTQTYDFHVFWRIMSGLTEIDVWIIWDLYGILEAVKDWIYKARGIREYNYLSYKKGIFILLAKDPLFPFL